jgi:hypothetical protein
MAPAASLELSQLDQLCSGNLDALLDDACRIASREGSFRKPQASPAGSAGKPPAAKASAAKKQVRSVAMLALSACSSSSNPVGQLVGICSSSLDGISQQAACFALTVVHSEVVVDLYL